MSSERYTTRTIGKRRWKVYKGLPTSSENVVNFGPQTAYNRIRVLTHAPFVNSALCFSHAAHGNRTQPNVATREEINGAYASRIRWRRIVNVNVTIEIRYLVSKAQNILS